MKIKSLTLRGFKSFPDRTKIEFHSGITAIVGPNGCGKSNISDALRWVLGEQRPTAIRGSRMEEAIFGGTEKRRATQRAEVVLEISNEDGALPVPYSEVSIGRTVYRGGESEYALNGGACRLRDILDLCRDTGLGVNAYALIEGRMVDAILSDRAEERRSLFEEAAAIGRYKDRRAVADRRLEQAEADLRRLDDVLVEVGSKVRSLAQQRGRAARYAKLRAELLRLEVSVATVQLEQSDRRMASARGELDRLGNEEPSADAAIQAAEAEAEALRLEGARMERERSEVARRGEQANRAVEEQQRAYLLAQERIRGARERLAALEPERRSSENRRADVAKRLSAARAAVERGEELRAAGRAAEGKLEGAAEALRRGEDARAAESAAARELLEKARRKAESWALERRVAGDRAVDRAAEVERRRDALDALARQARDLRRQVEQAVREESELGTKLKRRRATLDEAQEAAASAASAHRTARDEAAAVEGRLSAARARHSSLRPLVRSSALLPDVVAELLQARDDVPGICGALSEFIEVPARWALAVESRLGPYLHGVVVQDWAAVAAVDAWLAARDSEERALLLPLDPGPQRGPGADAPLGAVGSSAGAPEAEPLLGHVRVAGAGAPWATALLEGVDAAGDLEPAARPRPWVDESGRCQDGWGAVHVGVGGGRGVLSVRAELKRTGQEVAELESACIRSSEAASRAESEAAAARDGARRIRASIMEAESSHREAHAARASLEARLARLGDERDELKDRIEQLELFGDGEGDGPLSERGEARMQELEEAVSRLDAAHAAARAAAAEAGEAAQAKQSELHAAQLGQARREAGLASQREAVARLAEDLEEAEARLATLAGERERLGDEIAESEPVSVQAELSIGAGLEEKAKRDAKLAAIEQRILDGRESLERTESKLKDARRLRQKRAESRHALELETARLEAAAAAVRGRLEAEWDAPLEELRERAGPIEIDSGDRTSREAEVERLRRSIARIGPVNVLAEEDYQEEKARFDFLNGQRDDLMTACDDLRASIRRANKEATTALLATFEKVRRNFRDTFSSLFDGGECDLFFENPDDPLDSPIEIFASPRGKRTKRIHLLSGGERALTALALLFAIYLVKPSPFCLLDELDAPLDEANILRFVGMLEELKDETQFIVITHNPLTIARANWVYGVTMQEAGVSSIVGVELDAAATVA